MKVTIKPSNITFDVNQGETILQAALRQGVDFPYRCQQGVCSSCVCKLQQGEVSYPNTNTGGLVLKSANGDNFAYACVGIPDTDLILQHPFIN